MDKVILPYRGKSPAIDPTAFIAPSAAVIGDVTIGAHSSVWFGAVVRGDFQPIRIGSSTNIQDNATIHVMRDVPVEIGDHVLIGHNAVVHCSKIGSNTLIGMGSIVMGYSEIGENVVIGAGTFLPQHKKIPPFELARVRFPCTDRARAARRRNRGAAKCGGQLRRPRGRVSKDH